LLKVHQENQTQLLIALDLQYINSVEQEVFEKNLDKIIKMTSSLKSTLK